MPLPDHRIASVPHMSVKEGKRAAETLLTSGECHPDVIICVNDLVAIGAIRACREAGLSIPFDISITGYNDIPLLDLIDPALTTVRMQLHEIGKAAGQVMLAQFEGQPVAPMTQRVDCTLLVRASLGHKSQPRPT